MGAAASKPKEGTKIQVIGAGLSRSGTSSFSAALEELLDGPTYHCGTQVCLGPEQEVLGWNKLTTLFLQREQNQHQIRKLLAERLNGYAAVTDAPANLFTPELLELYPDAKVIVTTRDRQSWANSMKGLQNLVLTRFIRVYFYPLKPLCHFADFVNCLRGAWEDFYGGQEVPMEDVYDKHIAWLKEVVPADRLVFFDVREGWGPLCKALNKPIPNHPFPHINDADAIKTQAAKSIREGLTRWALLLSGVGAVVALGYRLL